MLMLLGTELPFSSPKKAFSCRALMSSWGLGSCLGGGAMNASVFQVCGFVRGFSSTQQTPTDQQSLDIQLS